jgi:hypothetical protein
MDSQKPQAGNEEQPPKPVRYMTRPLNQWNLNRRGDHQLDSATVACLHDPEITDRDRRTFALRELRRLGYEAEALPADWTKPVELDKAPGDLRGGSTAIRTRSPGSKSRACGNAQDPE